MYMYVCTYTNYTQVAYEEGCVPCGVVVDRMVLCRPPPPSWGVEEEGLHPLALLAKVEGQCGHVCLLLGEVQGSGRPLMTRERRHEHDCPSQVTSSACV